MPPVTRERPEPPGAEMSSEHMSAHHFHPHSDPTLSAPAAPALQTPSGDEPVPVVKVLSVRGVEYAMMSIALWFSAATLAWVVLNWINGSGGFDIVVVPLSALITTLPVFGLLFIRLKRAELASPALKFDPSKRRLSQTTQLLAFVAILINLSVFVYDVLQKINGNKVSIDKSVINLLVILVIAGGILLYYWFDEHRNRR